MAKSFEDPERAAESQGASVPPSPSPMARPLEQARRFERQVRYAPFGRTGQANLVSARVLVVGCGALGGVLAESFHRAGVGELVLVDRDVVELSNLPRQVLFEEHHARQGTPKALAARESLERIGGPTRVEAHVRHLDARNLELLADDVDLVLDGTDNLATRYLLNDFCVERGLPWVYAGVVGAAGLVLPVLPGRGACLACVFPEAPPEESLPTCDTAGVLGPAVLAVASFAAGLGLRILARPEAPPEPALLELDVWHGSARRLSAPRDPLCRVCGARHFDHLHRTGAEPIALCGRNTVQIPARGPARALAHVARALDRRAAEVQLSEHLLRFRFEDLRVSLFPDGRGLVEGTHDVARAEEAFSRALAAGG